MSIDNVLRGLVDLHIHTAPDIRPRRLDDIEQARVAQRIGVAGIVLKSHNMATVDRARVAQVAVPGIRVLGGITLNQPVGGINPAAVRDACERGARIVWLPTLDARNHRRLAGEFDGIEVSDGHRLTPEAREVVRIVADHDVALATGHLSPAEIRAVVEAASNAGLRRIVVTHPEHAVVALPLDEQIQLGRDHAVYFERCYAQPAGDGTYRTNLAVNLEAIRTVGAASTIIATDSGQIESAPWVEALRNYLGYLRENGVTGADLRHMTRAAPAFVCGLAAERPVYSVSHDASSVP